MTIFWYKAFHLIGMVAWFAGMFYLFRLFVYHAENKDNQDRVDMLVIMQRRLYRGITLPAMIFTWIFGLLMLWENPGYFSFKWVHIKLTCVLVLTIYTFYMGYVRKRFLNGDVFLSSKACRILNEFPTPFLIAIVLLAVLRPFD